MNIETDIHLVDEMPATTGTAEQWVAYLPPTEDDPADIELLGSTRDEAIAALELGEYDDDVVLLRRTITLGPWEVQ